MECLACLLSSSTCDDCHKSLCSAHTFEAAEYYSSYTDDDGEQYYTLWVCGSCSYDRDRHY